MSTWVSHRMIFSSETRPINHQALGDRLAFDARYRTHRTLNSQLKATSPVMLLLTRVQTEGSVQFSAFIKSERSFGDGAAAENAGLFLYYGVILVMAFFNLFMRSRLEILSIYPMSATCWLFWPLQ